MISLILKNRAQVFIIQEKESKMHLMNPPPLKFDCRFYKVEIPCINCNLFQMKKSFSPFKEQMKTYFVQSMKWLYLEATSEFKKEEK